MNETNKVSLLRLFQNSSKEQIGQRIAHIRKERGVKQEELAEMLGITGRMMHNIEDGSNLPYKHIVNICEILQINPVELMINNPEMVAAFRSVDYLVPFFADISDYYKKKPFYYYNAPDWIVKRYTGVIALDVRILNQSSILIDDSGIIYVATKVELRKMLENDLVLFQKGRFLRVVKKKEKGPSDKVKGLVLAQEKRFIDGHLG